jgi:hypothetical protein
MVLVEGKQRQTERESKKGRTCLRWSLECLKGIVRTALSSSVITLRATGLPSEPSLDPPPPPPKPAPPPMPPELSPGPPEVVASPAAEGESPRPSSSREGRAPRLRSIWGAGAGAPLEKEPKSAKLSCWYAA